MCRQMLTQPVGSLLDHSGPRQRQRQKPRSKLPLYHHGPPSGQAGGSLPSHQSQTNCSFPLWPKEKQQNPPFSRLSPAKNTEPILVVFIAFIPGLEGGRAFFNAVKEGDTVIFASDDEQDRILWVQAMYRATGQSHKPVPPTQVQKLNAKGGNVPQLDAPISQFCKQICHLLKIVLQRQSPKLNQKSLVALI